jgi:hypothetical protein
MILLKPVYNEKNITLTHLINILKMFRAEYKKLYKDGKIDAKLFGGLDIRFKGLMSFFTWGATSAMTQMNSTIISNLVFTTPEKRDKAREELKDLVAELKSNEGDTYKQFSAIFKFVKNVFANDGKNSAWIDMVDCIKKFEGQ